MAEAVAKENLVVAAVLSGNRNFEGRINPLVKANYLASPPLVVAYAIAGTMDIDLAKEPLGQDPRGRAGVSARHLADQRRSAEHGAAVDRSAGCSSSEYAQAFEGDENWRTMPVPTGSTFQWDEKSTYIKKPPYFDHMVDPATSIQDLAGMRVLAMLGDSVTTDHISPAGSIAKDSPGGQVSDRAGRASRRTSTRTARGAGITR